MNQTDTYDWNPEYTAHCDEMNGLADEEERAIADEAEAESQETPMTTIQDRIKSKSQTEGKKDYLLNIKI